MQEASFAGLIRTLIYIIGFYYLFKFLSRIFLPILLQKAANKMQENFNKHQNTYNQQNNQDFQTQKKENLKPTKQVGDYIDYEEVE
jgi:hypothetical protein